MKSYFWALLALLLAFSAASIVNTTEFWRRSLNETDMHYQAFAGYQEINWYRPRGESGMYYQLYGCMGSDLSKADASVPLIIWLQGGPGSSSLFGAFTELGPIRIVQGQPKNFAYPWNVMGHLLFIDQPLNVGLSYFGNRTGDKQVSTANEAALHLVNFLSNFYKDWPQLRDSPLYITGESFAGHYIPAFARQIITNSTFLAETKVQLKGVAIGDGWTDPINQINFFDSLLYSAGIVSNKYRDAAGWYQTQAILSIYKKAYTNATAYFDVLNNHTNSEVYWGGISTYNIRQYESGDQTYIDFVQKNKGSLGAAQGIDYLDGNGRVYDSFQADITTSYSSDIVILLRHIKVLIFNGQNDFVVNTAGVLQYLNGLTWEEIGRWKRAKKEVWSIHNEIRGWAKVYGNLWFALVNGAGHMVPTDQPESAFNLLGHFISNDRNWRT